VRPRAVALALALVAFVLTPAPAAAVHGAPDAPLSLVPAAELVKSLATNPRPVVVDLRPADAFRQGRLPGARSVPLRELRRRVGELAAGRIVLYCDCPAEELDAAYRFLRDRGFADVQALAGGFAAWVAAGLPVER
jgi:rhodanese-related sulfurtransferase